jgi:hypothetical protein
MCIVTGPNIDIAIKLIKRMKALFEPKLHVTFDSKETVLELNGCTIEAYPSNHIDAYRALDNPKFILIDEGDFFRKGEQADARDVSERYIAKSDPYIVMVSTPNAPDGLFERIEKESEETCIYKRLFLDYTYDIGSSELTNSTSAAPQEFSFKENLKVSPNLKGVVISGPTNKFVDSIGAMHIVGELRNDGTKTLNVGQIVATIYGLDYATPTPATLSPGKRIV